MIERQPFMLNIRSVPDALKKDRALTYTELGPEDGEGRDRTYTSLAPESSVATQPAMYAGFN